MAVRKKKNERTWAEKKNMNGKLKYYLRHIDVESETHSTQPQAQSQTLSPARLADFGPFFVEFGVFFTVFNFWFFLI